MVSVSPSSAVAVSAQPPAIASEDSSRDEVLRRARLLQEFLAALDAAVPLSSAAVATTSVAVPPADEAAVQAWAVERAGLTAAALRGGGGGNPKPLINTSTGTVTSLGSSTGGGGLDDTVDGNDSFEKANHASAVYLGRGNQLVKPVRVQKMPVKETRRAGSPISPGSATSPMSPNGSFTSAGTSGICTPRGVASPKARRKPRGSPTECTDAAVITSTAEADLAAQLRSLAPDIAAPLHARVSNLLKDISSARTRVQEMHQRNKLIVKEVGETKRTEAKITDLDRHNKMFGVRTASDFGRFQSEEEVIAEATRERQEICLMGAEDAAVERLMIRELKEAMANCCRDNDAILQARTCLEGMHRRLKDLEAMKAEGQRMARENANLFDQIQSLRKASAHRRWR